MKEQNLRNIIRESLISALKEQNNEEGVFTPAEEKFLAKFVELGATSLGILYNKNQVGIREFLMRSGKDYNLTPDVLAKLMKDGIISIVPYGGYARNQDYTLQCNLPLDELEGLSSGDADTGEESEDPASPAPSPAAPEPDLPAGEPQESISSADLSKLLVSEQKIHTKTRVYSAKSRALRRLPKGYIVYLERIIQILGQKLHTDLEKQHLVADILDNLAHNFGLTPKQVYKSFIFYNSQNRLKNVVKEQLEDDTDMIKLKRLLEQARAKQTVYKTQPITGTFLANYVTPSTAWRTELDPIIKAIQELVKKRYRLDQIKVIIRSGASKASATNRYKGKNPPNHNFVTYGEQENGLLPGGVWINKDNKKPDGTTGTYQNVDGGNTFLAAERGKQLKAKIEPVLKQLFPQMPANFVMIDPQENSEQFVSYQVQYAATPQVKPTDEQMKAWLQGTITMDLGGEHLGLNTLKFTGQDWPNLDKEYAIWRKDTSKIPPAVAPRSRSASGSNLVKKTFGTILRPTDYIADLGLGPGQGIPLTRKLYQWLGFQINLPAFRSTNGLKMYGGSMVDMAQEEYIIAKHLESIGEDPPGSAERVAQKHSAVLNPDGSPKGYATNKDHVAALGPKPGPIQWNTLNPATKNQTRPDGQLDSQGKGIGTPTDPNTNDPRAFKQKV